MAPSEIGAAAAPPPAAEAARPDFTSTGPVAAGTDAAPRPAAPAPAAAFAPAAPVRQVMDAVVTAQSDRFEIALSPEELGRVRITISHAEHGLTVHLAAEREDTMGLLRRHAADLSRALAEMGLGSADIAFGDGMAPGGDGDGDGRRRGRSVTGLIHSEAGAAPPPTASRTGLSGRMDLRL